MDNRPVVTFRQIGLWWEVWWSYDPVLVNMVWSLPPTHRQWLAEEKHWRINQLSVRRLAMDIAEVGYQIDGLDLTAHDWAVHDARDRSSWVENRWRTPFRKDIDG